MARQRLSAKLGRRPPQRAESSMRDESQQTCCMWGRRERHAEHAGARKARDGGSPGSTEVHQTHIRWIDRGRWWALASVDAAIPR